MKTTRCTYGLLLIAFSVTVAMLVRNCNAATIGSALEEVPNNRTNGTSSYDDYYTEDEDYDYKEDNTLHSVDPPSVPSDAPQTLASTSSSSTITSSTSTTTVSEVETNLLDDAPAEQIEICPLECRCSQGVVNCSGVHLSAVPTELPRSLVSLDLSSNRIAKLDLNAFLQFPELRQLNLSHNQIHHIQKLAKDDSRLPRLTAIDLEDNQLTGVIDPDTFTGLPGLQRLELSNNSITLPEQSLFNLPALEELYLRNCTLDELSGEMFSNLMGLKILDLSDNPPFKTDPDSNTFEPLTSIKKLNLGVLGEEQVLELCTMLTTIDVIHFPDFKISCFEYVNGYTFEQSIVSNTPAPEFEDPYVPSVGEPDIGLSEEEEVHRENEVSEHLAQDPVEEVTVSEVEEAKPRANIPTTTTPTTELPLTNVSSTEPQQGEVNHDLMNQILLIIILMAFIGLVIGVICRRDYCGIKTKCCRTRRSSQTDQVTPAPEEVPLNKITVVPSNGNNHNNNNGNGATAPLNSSE